MPSLILQYEHKTLKSYSLEEGTTLSIGRNKGNGVVIENLGVSGHHAKIDCIGDKFLLTDLQSKNGTFVNGTLVQTCWLKDGDVVMIGKHALVFEQNGAANTRVSGEDMSDKTLMIETEEYQAMLEKSFSRIDLENVSRETVGSLTTLNGDVQQINLSKKLTKIGKDPFNDFVIEGLFVGKTAAAISQRPSGYHLSYVGGWSRPKVNGESVKKSVRLNDLDVIQIGPIKMQFNEKFLYKK